VHLCRVLAATFAITTTGLALADSVGPPLGPVDRSIVAEQPCDPAAPLGSKGALIAPYMCQIALDDKWFQPYPCAIIKSSARSSYLRFEKWNVPCDVTGSVNHKTLSFSGNMACSVHDPEPDMIGDVAFVERTKLVAVPGGFRLELKKIERHKDFASGPDHARKPRTEVSRPKLTFNVCRRPWPKDFVSDNERAEAMRKSR
jgi:hypothetical protein